MSPEDWTVVAWLAFVLAGIGLGVMLGIIWERDRRDALIEEAADATVDELVARQVAEDRAAIHSMPPGIDASDAVAYAAELGISVREAALILFRAQARARLEGNLGRHYRTANRSKR